MSTNQLGGWGSKKGYRGKKGEGGASKRRRAADERPEGRLEKNSLWLKISLGALFPGTSDRGTSRKKATRRSLRKKQPLHLFLKITSAAAVNFLECLGKNNFIFKKIWCLFPARSDQGATRKKVTNFVGRRNQPFYVGTKPHLYQIEKKVPLHEAMTFKT